MRRFITLIAIASALTLAACSLPPGVDGNLVNNWSPIASPAQKAPHVGDCYRDPDNDILSVVSLPCSQEHLVEVAYVGRFAGADAARTSPPPAFSTSMVAAYAACQAPVAAYLGAQWNSGMVAVTVTSPTPSGWDGGARWFRCDISAIRSLENPQAASSDASLKGALAAGSKQTCVKWTNYKTYVDDIVPKACTGGFSGEYVGFYTAPDETFPANDTKMVALAQDGCEDLVARFLGFKDWNADTNAYVGLIALGFDWGRWARGDRTTRCFTWTDRHGGTFLASVKGIHGAKPTGF
jgi:hypothetical protein